MTEVTNNAWPLAGYAPGNYLCICCDCAGQFEGDKRAFQCIECAAKAVNLSLRQSHSTGAVKGLEWVFGQRTAEARVPFGEYQIAEYTEQDGMGYVVCFNDNDEIGEFATSDEAVKAAQADYERRILSALSPVQDGEPVAWICDGCGRLSKDPQGDLHALRVSGALSCCPERKLLPLYTHPSKEAEVTVTEEMVERAARSLCVTIAKAMGEEPPDPEDMAFEGGQEVGPIWTAYLHEAREALLAASISTPARKARGVSVPREPTEAMVEAYWRAPDTFRAQMEAAKRQGNGWKSMPAVVWDVMLTAALSRKG